MRGSRRRRQRRKGQRRGLPEAGTAPGRYLSRAPPFEIKPPPRSPLASPRTHVTASRQSRTRARLFETLSVLFVFSPLVFFSFRHFKPKESGGRGAPLPAGLAGSVCVSLSHAGCQQVTVMTVTTVTVRSQPPARWQCPVSARRRDTAAGKVQGPCEEATGARGKAQSDRNGRVAGLGGRQRCCHIGPSARRLRSAAGRKRLGRWVRAASWRGCAVPGVCVGGGQAGRTRLWCSGRCCFELVHLSGCSLPDRRPVLPRGLRGAWACNSPASSGSAGRVVFFAG